ncbi:MAG: DUF4912 domain-containing protein [Cyanobacteria bacterium K_Offshore_surface_m2_239]|nr:DUF4912 domain-containing protein [Cyanobacteria bacterium K_Offshore_surface_m2_239]
MGSFGFSKDRLSQMRLSQLRELARRLGIWRYSSMLRDQLVSAIQVRSPEAELPTPAAPAPAPSTVEEHSHAADVDAPALAAPAVTADAATADQPSAAEPISASWVSLMPQDHQWAIARWSVATSDRERALAAGGQELALRLTDVNGSHNGQALPHAVQQVVVSAGANEWHLPVPVGDRAYRVELGYRTADGGWYPLVVSSVVRMPAEADGPMESLSPFTLATAEQIPVWSAPPGAPGLHERLYQQATASRRRLGLGSEGFQEHGAEGLAGAGGQLSGAGGQVSGAGAWASGREASGAGLTARQRSFWLVADAELLVYGATDPAATLRVGDREVPLAEDGTFSFHATFPDGEQHYPIRALAADGEQHRSITLDFARTTPHAKVNTREEAVDEWF